MTKRLSAVSALVLLASCTTQSGRPEVEQELAALSKNPVDPADPADPKVNPHPGNPNPPPAQIWIPPNPLPFMPHDSCDPRHVMGLAPMSIFVGIAGMIDVPQPCPAAGGGWVGGEHFAATSDVNIGGQRVCSYELPPNLPFTLNGLPQLVRYPGGPLVAPKDWATADCTAVTTLGDDDEALDLVLPEFIASFRARIARQATLPIVTNGSGCVTGPARVEVAILDSLDDEGTPPDPAHLARQEHGRAVRSIISDVTCPAPINKSSACVVQLRNYQLFDLADGGQQWVDHEKNTTTPDPYRRKSAAGYLLRLARRIDDAVNSAAERGIERLIINLSVGFHSRFTGFTPVDDVYDWNLATKTIQAALKRATCSGALVIAAVGNREDGTQPWNQAFFPGFMHTWNTQDCPTGEADRPLLYAASGLNPGGSPISNAIDQPYSTDNKKLETPFAAPGFAVGAPTGADAPARLMTGSSFGAAGVSAVAALAWSYQPQLTAQQVMALVHDTAGSTGRNASQVPALWLNGQTGGSTRMQVKGVSACAALASAMSALCTSQPGSSACAQIPQCATLSTNSPVTSTAATTGQALLDLVPVQNRHEFTYATVQTIPSTCLGAALGTLRAVQPAVTQDPCPWMRPNVLGAAYYPGNPGQPVPLYTAPPSSPCRPGCIIVKSDPPPDDGSSSFVGDDTGSLKKVIVKKPPAAKKHLVIGIDPAYRGELSSATLRMGGKTLALGNSWIDAATDGLVSFSLPDDFEDAATVLTFDKLDDQTSISAYVPML